MTNLADPDTGLGRFVPALAATAAEVAPVAETQAQLFVALDTTFTSLAEVARPFIQETISESPPTLDAGTAGAPGRPPVPGPQRDALHRAASPASRRWPTTAPIARPRRSRPGPRPCATRPSSTASSPPTAEALERFNDDTGVRNGHRAPQRDRQHPRARRPFVTPAQTVCNYGTLLFRNLASSVAQGTDGGRWQRISVFEPPEGPNSEGTRRRPRPTAAATDNDNFLHYNPYPNTAAPGQTRRVRGRQRALRGWPAGDRQRAGQPGHRHRGPAGSRRPPRTRRMSFWRRGARRDPRPAGVEPDTRVWGRNYRGPRRGSSAC